MDEYDVVIIGGGAAGLSAALVLSRARRRVAVIDAGAPRNAPAAHMHGFLSRDGMAPLALLAVGRAEVEGYGGRLLAGRVDAITRSTDRFTVVRDSGPALSARRVLVTTGLRDAIPDIPGLRERWGRDVLHCPYCHGYEVRDQPLAVLGGSPGSVQHAQLVRQWSADLIFFLQGDVITSETHQRLAARGITVVDRRVTRLVVEHDRLTGLQLDDGRVVHRAAVFVRPRFVPNNSLLSALGCELDEAGWPAVDSQGRTSVAGISVAGNVADPRAQVITAAGHGSAAAIALQGDLVDEDVRNALPTLTPVT